MRLECVDGLGQAAHPACSIFLVNDAFLGNLLDAGDCDWQQVFGGFSVTCVDGFAQVSDLGPHRASVVTVVRASLDVLSVPLHCACDVGHCWLPMNEL